MKGATLEPCPKTISIPNIPRIKKIGYNQIFFLSIKNDKNSFKKLIIIIKKCVKIFEILKCLNIHQNYTK